MIWCGNWKGFGRGGRLGTIICSLVIGWAVGSELQGVEGSVHYIVVGKV